MEVVLADPVRNGSHSIEAPTPWEELNDAVRVYQDITEKSNKAFQAIELSRRAIDEARQARQDRLAASVLDGGRVPQKDGVAAAEHKHAETIELSAATAQALTMAFQRIEALIEQHRGDWVGSAAVAEADATAAYASAVDAVASAREAMMAARVHSAFVRGFPQHKAGWIPDRLTVAIDGAKLPFTSVELALKREAGTVNPEPRTLPEQVAALKETAGAKTVTA